MKKVDIGILILFIYFTLDIIGVPNFVDSPGILSPDMFWWLMFLILIIINKSKGRKNDTGILTFIIIWNAITFIDHWRYTFFGVSAKKLLGYNKYFQGTHHIIPASDVMLIPDTYHIILTILLIINLGIMLKKLYSRKHLCN